MMRKAPRTSEYTREARMGGGRPPRTTIRVSSRAGDRERMGHLMDLRVSKETGNLGGLTKTRR